MSIRPFTANEIIVSGFRAITTNDTGIFSDISKVVFITGDQNISGEKHFYDTVIIAKYVSGASNGGSINFGNKTLRTQEDTASVNWQNRSLSDSNTKSSLHWNTRQLHDTGESISIDWGVRQLSGDWSVYSLSSINQITASGFRVITTNDTGSFSTSSTPSGFYPLQIQGAKLPTGSPARIDAGENNWRLLFASGAVQSASWQFIMPPAYTTGLQARIHFTMNSGQSGTKTVVWNLYSFSSQPNSDSVDINTKPFSINSGTHTLANNQSSGLLREQVISLTNYTGLANHFTTIKLERSGTVDTSVGDAEVLGLNLEYR